MPVEKSEGKVNTSVWQGMPNKIKRNYNKGKYLEAT
jgi:hypothetical protein